MTLKSCPTCGHSTSIRAVACPNCGETELDRLEPREYEYYGRITLVQHSKPYKVRVMPTNIDILSNDPRPSEQIEFQVDGESNPRLHDRWHSKQFENGDHCIITVNEYGKVIFVRLIN